MVQAQLLQSFFAAFTGSPKLLQQAETSCTGLVAACKRLHLLRSQVSAARHVSDRGAGAEEVQRALKQDHRRRRLGWAIFVSDYSSIRVGSSRS